MLHVFDAKTGKELGNVDLNGSTVATAAVVGDIVNNPDPIAQARAWIAATRAVA